MIAVDTSSFIAYLSGASGGDVVVLQDALLGGSVVLPFVVLTELLSDPKLDKAVRELLQRLPVLPVGEEFWERAGLLRAKILAKGFKARLADTLIAQNCLDHGVVLLTRDRDFGCFARIAGLQLIGFNRR